MIVFLSPILRSIFALTQGVSKHTNKKHNKNEKINDVPSRLIT